MLSILYGLISALSWGGGDFAGGLVSRRAGAYRATLYAEVLGLVFLLAGAAVFREPALSRRDWALSGIAGAFGAVGLLIFYQALAAGRMSIAAPVSALMAALLPVAAGALTEGLPDLLTYAGFALALAAMWLISQGEGSSRKALVRIADLRLPLVAGVFFGIYFILMHQGSRQGLLWPLIAARSGGAIALMVFTAAMGHLRWPEASLWPLVSLNAAGDIGGNTFYILAGQAGRMDVAAVLGSLYPGTTVLLAWLVLHERLTRLQWIGILAALGAIVLMTV